MTFALAGVGRSIRLVMGRDFVLILQIIML